MAKFDFSESIEACAARYGEEADAVRTYMNEGLEAALALPNRGPIKFNEDGSLDRSILNAYSKYGFYIFEGVIGATELADIEEDLEDLRGRIRNHVDWSVELADRLRAEPDFEITTDPVLSLFSFRHTPDEVRDLDAHNLALINAINDDGRIYLTQTNHEGQFVIRFVAGQFDMRHEDIDIAFEAITEVARNLG